MIAAAAEGGAPASAEVGRGSIDLGPEETSRAAGLFEPGNPPATTDLSTRPIKGNPESFELRGRPRPVVRFRRWVIVGGTGGLAIALAAVAWLAFDTPGLRLAASGDPEAIPALGAVPEALSGAPQSYGEVPQLGPPLPGDLGRPILEHRRSLEDDAQADLETDGMDPARAAAAAESQRRQAEQLAAQSSPVMVQRATSLAPGEGNGVSAGPADQAAEPLGADRGSAPMLRPRPSRWTLAAGTVIPASLITGLNSDLPGTVVAQVTEPVRDSATGRAVLIPQGARLIGNYSAVVAFGQRRALLVWQRIVLPDGASVALDDIPVADLAGYAGLEDEVDFHTWRLLQGIALSTLFGVGTEIGLGGHEGDLVRAVREAAQQNAGRAGDQIVARNLDIRPTITVRPGWPVRAIVNKDLVLEPWRPVP